MSHSQEFKDTYGMRFIGLEDGRNSVYLEYRVPDPWAPYPQDFIIDQEGIVRYWSPEYDPQKIIAVIDELLGIERPDGGGSAVPSPVSASVTPGLLLSPPSPNPFLDATTVRFRLPVDSRARVTVYDIAGQRVRVLADGIRRPGEHRIVWDGRDQTGRRAAAGVYYFRLETEGEARTAQAIRLH